MKKKIITSCLVVALLVVGIVGASLAYFTDKDEETNTFTVGKVKIQLNEQQRNAEGTALEAFKQNKVLNPIVGSAQGEKDQFGMPTAKNYVDKMVTVKNTGKNDAYIRAYFAIPSALDDGEETFNAGLNVLHFNFGNKVKDGTVTSTYQNEWIWQTDDGAWNYFETTIDGIAYNVYYADYATVVPAEATTEQFVQGVYLDKTFNMKDGKYYVTQNGKEVEVDLSQLINDKGELVITCPVFAVAVQADGFDNAAQAMDAAFGANYNPWK